MHVHKLSLVSLLYWNWFKISFDDWELSFQRSICRSLQDFFFFFLVLVEKRMIKQYLPLHKLLLGISVPCWTLRSIEMTVGKKSGYDLIRMLDYKGFLQY